MPSGGSVRILLSSFLFILTGLVQTISIQSVLYSGGGDRSTFLLAIPNYLGIVCVNFFGARAFRFLDTIGVWTSNGNELNRVHLSMYPHRSTKYHQQLSFFSRLFHRDRRKLFILAFNELGGFLTGLTGLSIAGSGLYQVVFSGATVFTALLTTIFLKNRLSIPQWLSVALITIGLMITAEQVTRSPSNSSTSSTDDSGTASLISGLAFVLVSCLFYSTNYVIAEHILSTPSSSSSSSSSSSKSTTTTTTTTTSTTTTTNIESNDDEHHQLVNNNDSIQPTITNTISTLPPPSGLDLSLYTGGSCLLFFSIYIMAHTVPNWNELVTSSIAKHHGNTTLIIEYYIYLFIASFVHAITHYDVVATVGAVPIGVLNALRAVSVFAVSSFLFCTHQASQCYNSRKGISTAIVIGGALAYSAASAAVSSTNYSSTKLSSKQSVKKKKKKNIKSTSENNNTILTLSSSSSSKSKPSSIREKSRHHRFIHAGRRLRKAVSTYIGFNSNNNSNNNNSNNNNSNNNNNNNQHQHQQKQQLQQRVHSEPSPPPLRSSSSSTHPSSSVNSTAAITPNTDGITTAVMSNSNPEDGHKLEITAL